MRQPLVVAAALVAAAALPSSALASFPGRNGIFAVAEGNCAVGDTGSWIHAIRTSGDEGAELTDRCDYIGDPDDEFVRSTHSPDWSPDGRRLLYLDDGGPKEPVHFKTVGPDGTGVQNLGAAPTAGAGDPSWAPDGKRYVFASEDNLHIGHTDGLPRSVLRGDAAAISQPQWSPKGNTIAVVREGGRKRQGLWLIDALTGEFLHRVAKGDVASFDWSPDGRRLVFATGYDQGENGKVKGANLYIARASGKGRPRLFVRTRNVAATVPAWSPDRKSIAWVRLRFTAGDVGFRVIPTLLRRRVRGGSVKRVVSLDEPFVEEGYYASPDITWQPRPRG